MEKELNRILSKHQETGGNIISILQDIQETFGYIPEDAVNWFSERLNIPAAKFYGVATFYSHFRLKPRGKNTITICCGAACHIKGSKELLEHVREILSIKEDEDTTEDLKFTIQEATCIGACNIAPVVLINNSVYGNMEKDKLSKLIKGFVDEDEFIGY
ncbi:MAG: NAD(P)H-dependent oxidoreductase subunit E [Nitrospirae bacterium]|nr:NAD(P)H-dependent oxidoreductase subunit E [Nitrospirota bacterium]